ncbi:ASST-domain-containing protein [Xylaria sp. FL0064]|nr:ASST-domain-containing protein [Xylaria sp. FL0064]
MWASPLAVLLQCLWIRTAYGNSGIDGADDLFKFVTRPDLMSPKWNITYHDREQIAPGYWFTTPFRFIGHRLDDVKWVPCQMGPMIYDNDGELVWSGACQFNQRITYDLFPIEFGGQTVLKAIVMNSEFPVSDCGAGLYINEHYEMVHNFFIDKENSHVNIHEFNYIQRRNTTLVTTRRPRQWSGHALGLMEDLVWIDSNGFRAYDMTTGNITFQWHAEYHVSLEESTMAPAYSIAPDYVKERVPFTNFTHDYLWDPWHINSVDENSDGNYLVSFRHMDTIMLIAGDDGRVLWRLGGKHSDYILEDGLKFSRQHHARYISHSPRHDVISFLDNASGEQRIDFQPPSNNYSRGLIVELLRPEGQPQRARILQEYKRPDRGLADRRGALQQLPNGNVFMSWTDAGYLSEHTFDDRVLMEARFLNEIRLGTYRVYKSTNWIGRPKQPPDVKALGYGIGTKSMTAIYVSWNGATEHKIWKFFSGDRLLGQTNRTGFETVFVTDVLISTVRAEAFDSLGNYLGKSNDVPPEYPKGWVPKLPEPPHVELPQPLEDPGSVLPVVDNIPLGVDTLAPSENANIPGTPMPSIHPTEPMEQDIPVAAEDAMVPDASKAPANPTKSTEVAKPNTSVSGIDGEMISSPMSSVKPTEPIKPIEGSATPAKAEEPIRPTEAVGNPIYTDGSKFSDVAVTTETRPLYLALLGIPCAIGCYVLLRILYRQIRSLIASQWGYSKEYMEIPS